MRITETDIEKISAILHETNRAICQASGDYSQVAWDQAPQWQRDAAVKGVRELIANSGLTPEQLHEAWCAAKYEEGWQHGTVKDPLLKTHPSLVHYSELPVVERVKDHVFRAVALNVIAQYHRQEEHELARFAHQVDNGALSMFAYSSVDEAYRDAYYNSPLACEVIIFKKDQNNDPVEVSRRTDSL